MTRKMWSRGTSSRRAGRRRPRRPRRRPPTPSAAPAASRRRWSGRGRRARSAGGERVAQRQVEVAGQQVARAERHEAHRDAGADERPRRRRARCRPRRSRRRRPRPRPRPRASARRRGPRSSSRPQRLGRYPLGVRLRWTAAAGRRTSGLEGLATNATSWPASSTSRARRSARALVAARAATRSGGAARAAARRTRTSRMAASASDARGDRDPRLPRHAANLRRARCRTAGRRPRSGPAARECARRTGREGMRVRRGR